VDRTGAEPDGQNPYGNLIEVNGRLYGTTDNGGVYGNGTVFRISPTGKEVVLHSFGTTGTDGKHPVAGLLNVNGTLYGTTKYGGPYKAPDTLQHGGTVFALTP
jgi:uncharacterized repeat protein (TIGR03803 family)